MRAVLDPNVLISALLSPLGAPSKLLRAWIGGEFELVVSPMLLEELRRALAYPKLAPRITPQEASWFIDLLERGASQGLDPGIAPPVRCADPGYDHLIALAPAARATLVSGDRHLLELHEVIPVRSARAFRELRLNAHSRSANETTSVGR